MLSGDDFYSDDITSPLDLHAIYHGNSTAGADQGQDIDPDDEPGWECEECGHVFFVASASSIEEGGEIIPGVECPECGAFVFTD